jgi:hypothetical protein
VAKTDSRHEWPSTSKGFDWSFRHYIIEREENLQRFDDEDKDFDGPYRRLQRFRGAEVLSTDYPLRKKAALFYTTMVEQWAALRGSR